MAWKAPRTWTPGEPVTAEVLNAHLRDDFRVVERTTHGDMGGSHSDYVSDHLVLGPIPTTSPSTTSIALTVAAGAAAAVDLKQPVTRRGLLGLRWFERKKEGR